MSLSIYKELEYQYLELQKKRSYLNQKFDFEINNIDKKYHNNIYNIYLNERNIIENEIEYVLWRLNNKC